MRINLVGGSYSFTSCFGEDFADGVVDLQTCINYYPQATEAGGGQNALIPTSGLRLKYDLGDSIKALKTIANGWVIAVAGGEVWRIRRGVKHKLGQINTPFSRVSVAENGRHVLIAAGQQLFSIDLTNWQLSPVSSADANTQKAHVVDFLDGYFVYAFRGMQGKFGWSNLYSLDFPALNFASAEGRPDKLVTLKVLGRELWVFGETSTEVYYNSGDKNLPFRRISGAFMTFGCEAPHSVTKISSSLIFLARTEEGGRQVVQTQGYQPKRISTHAIEAKLQTLPETVVNNATAFAYQEYGHYFYVLSFNEANLTLAYDLVTGLWHQRAYLNSHKKLEAHRAAFFTYNGINLVGDRENGSIYEITALSPTDNGMPIYRERTLPILSNDKQRVRHDRFEIEAKTDLKNATAALALCWSDDYGRTWTRPKEVSLAAKGESTAFAVWRKLGTAKNRSYRISTLSRTRVPLVSGYLNTQLG